MTDFTAQAFAELAFDGGTIFRVILTCRGDEEQSGMFDSARRDNTFVYGRGRYGFRGDADAATTDGNDSGIQACSIWVRGPSDDNPG